MPPNDQPEQPENSTNEEASHLPTPLSASSNYGQHKKSKKKLIISVLLVLLLVGAGAAYWFILKKDPEPQKATTNQQAAAPEPKQEEIDAELAKFIKPTTGETWLAAPKPIAKQGFYKPDAGVESEVQYYEVGKHGANTILMSVWQVLGDDIRLYEKAPNGTVTLVARPDGEAVYNQDQENFSDYYVASIKVDKDIHYDSLTVPRKLDLDKGYKLGKSSYPSLGDYNRPIEKSDSSPVISDVKTLGGSKLQRSYRIYTDTKLTSIGYQLITPINTVLPLTYEPLELKLDGYQWQSGYGSTDTLKAISRGCGGLYSSVTRADAITDADVTQIGKSPSGLVIYELKNPNHVLLQKAYDEFKEFTANTNEPNASINKADFIKQHAVILHKDKFDQWLVYVSEGLAPAYGCAKPVVYLYPQTAQNVNVRVGADVKVSEPLYNPLKGWQNVLAQPNGRLTYNGKQYGSLFWEGPGIGAYPSINSGTVVRTSDALATIHNQLAQLGLNAQETADFETYWKDKLPAKPYTRLTWLTTADMNAIAPLYITPKPDTVIRVFLDYAGLDAPVQIAPQKLSTIPRTGFTVVEWGGLSPTKLY